MHEASIAEALLEQIAEAASRHGARRVVGARVAVGALSAVEPAALAFAFELMRAGTIAAACELVLEARPLVVACPACGYSGPQDAHEPGCPRCQAVPVSVVSGRELCLVSLEVEDDDARAT